MLNAGVLVLLAAVLGLGLYVRLAPSDPARWHVAPPDGAIAPGAVVALPGAARLHLAGDGALLLDRVGRVMAAMPRTSRLAGSVPEGRVTWVARSRLWAFPDYITAEARADGLHIHARLRFGRDDLGVNARRLETVQAALRP